MNLEIIKARAGTGKTTRLVRVITDAILRREVRPERVMATTFTVRAAQELVRRTRIELPEEDAVLLGTALIGTVHGIGGRLLADFAYELGLSPSLAVMPEEDSELFLREALAEVFGEQPYLSEVEEAAEAFGFTQDDWQDHVRRLMEAARTNVIPFERLTADGNVAELLAFLDPVTAEPLDELFRAAVELAHGELVAAESTRKNTAKYVELLEASRVRPSWNKWAKLGKWCPEKPLEVYALPVQQAALAYMRHPRLRQHMEQYLRGVTHFARGGLAMYQEFKANGALMDFVDQEERVLELLSHDAHRARVAERIDLLVVDEFQDTSPLQLAIFLKLAQVVPRVVWVGDPDQSIYGFRGADPALMESAVLLGVEGERLEKSWRCLPDLATLVTDVFEGTLTTARPPGDSDCAHVWLLSASCVDEDAQCVATGVARLLETYQGSDIAVLCRTNAGCQKTADALREKGIEASSALPGLLATTEGRLVEAALRLSIDARDSAAAATIAFVEGDDPDAWLAATIQAARSDGDRWINQARVQAVLGVRKRLQQATPVEAVELAFESLHLTRLCLSLPYSQTRLANMEAIRELAARYEGHCKIHRKAPTTLGMLHYFRRLAKAKEDLQAVGQGANVVQVLTYHAAKGLEWRVVVLTELDKEIPPQWSGVSVESTVALSAAAPLEGRSIRFWFSPFGALTKDVPFLDKVNASDIAKAREEAAKREARRLLYVGFTRAKDVLVLAARVEKDVIKARRLRDVGLTLPKVSGVWRGIPTTVWTLEPGSAGSDVWPASTWYTQPDVHTVRARSVVQASAFVGIVSVADTIVLGARLPITVSGDWDAFGTFAHAYFCSGVERVHEHAAVLREARQRLFAFIEERYPGGVVRSEWPLAFRDGNQEVWGRADLVVELPSGWVVVDHKTAPNSSPESLVALHGGQLMAYGRALAAASGRPVLASYLHCPFGDEQMVSVKA